MDSTAGIEGSSFSHRNFSISKTGKESTGKIDELLNKITTKKVSPSIEQPAKHGVFLSSLNAVIGFIGGAVVGTVAAPFFILAGVVNLDFEEIVVGAFLPLVLPIWCGVESYSRARGNL